MHCPKCSSERVRRSVRRGLREGVFLRFAGQAPYRCFACQARFFASTADARFGRRKRHRSLAGFLGFRGQQRRQFHRWLMTASLAAVLIWVAIYLVMHLAEPGAPPQPVAAP